MSRILVCPAEHAASVSAEHAPSHVLELASPGTPELDEVPGTRLHLRFHDIAEPRAGLREPTRLDVAALLAFGRSWDGTAPLLVHCQMGISRSPTAALVLAASARPAVPEATLAAALRRAAPCATPNSLMIRLADELLGRRGRLAAAARGIGRGVEYLPYRMAVLDLATID